MASVADSIVNDFNTIKSEYLNQKHDRETFYDELINGMGGDILGINQLLLKERQERQETHADILRSVKYLKERFVQLVDVRKAK